MKLNYTLLKAWAVGLSILGPAGISLPIWAEPLVANRDIYMGDSGEPVVMANRDKYSFEKSKSGTQIWSTTKDYALEVEKSADRLTRITEGFAAESDDSRSAFTTQTTSVAGGLIKSETRCAKERPVTAAKTPAKGKKAPAIRTEISCMTVTQEYCQHLQEAFEKIDVAAAAECLNVLTVLTEAYDNLAQDKEAIARLKRLGKTDQAAIEKLYAKRIEGRPTHFKTTPLDVSADNMAVAGGSLTVIMTLKLMCESLQAPKGEPETQGTEPAPPGPGPRPSSGTTAI